MRVLMWVVAVLVVLVVIGWLGFRVSPRPFGSPSVDEGPIETAPIPAGLPAPVERYLRVTYGEEVPVIHSAVLTGRGRIQPNTPIFLPARFRFVHESGTNYRHFFEVTWFGLPVLTVDEGIVDGASFFENPLLGTEYDEPGMNQGATLALWAEAIWFPAVLATDARIQWQPVDDVTALLRVPFEAGTETFVVRFDLESGQLTTMEAMRARTKDIDQKILWMPRSLAWDWIDGYLIPSESAVVWQDQGTPWAYFSVEDVVYNGDVSEYVRARGE